MHLSLVAEIKCYIELPWINVTTQTRAKIMRWEVSNLKYFKRQCKFQIKTEQIKSSKVFQKDKGPVRLCWYHIHVDPTGNESASNYFGRVWLAWCRRARHASLGAYSSHREEFLVASFPGSAGAAATAGAAPSHAAKSAVSAEPGCVALAAAHGPLVTYLVYILCLSIQSAYQTQV